MHATLQIFFMTILLSIVMNSVSFFFLCSSPRKQAQTNSRSISFSVALLEVCQTCLTSVQQQKKGLAPHFPALVTPHLPLHVRVHVRNVAMNAVAYELLILTASRLRVAVRAN